ncbi:chalcone synthase [Quercus suber]|uniref:Chalcone synthase n=1 Tax=Quercus suber TaxID=58331 RepID=A0AAW0KMI8_QUESU
MAFVENFREAQRAKGPATIMAIATTNSENIIFQKDYLDFYFRVTKSKYKTGLKEKLKRICENSAIRKRHFYHTEEILKANPKICTYNAPSLDASQDMVVPGLLGLNPNINRFVIYQQGCYAGGTCLHLANDLSKNNANARVLVVCAEITTMFFHGPSEIHLDILVGQTIFGEGAAAVIVGASPDAMIEWPLFELAWTGQSLIPNSEARVVGHLREMELTYYLSKNLPMWIGKNIGNCMVDAFSSIGISNWNSLFYVVYPGGPTVLDRIQESLGLEEGKLKVTRTCAK